jgi:ring-1,2-phenylacetyl-CoA epoxidase subunit PaaC
MLYGYAAAISGTTEDQLAFTRDERQYENLLLVELPRGDFAYTMMRQYLLDAFESNFFAGLCHSSDPTLAGIAAKTVKEVDYHLRRSQEWIRRLGLGTAESRQRLQAATDELWGYVDELFEADTLEQTLIDQGIAVNRGALEAGWRAAVTGLLTASNISLPDSTWQVTGGRRGLHTEHLGHLLSEMQYLQRAYPGQQW